MKRILFIVIALVTYNYKSQSQTLTAPPENSTHEGGDIQLTGASTYNDWRIDNFYGKYRLHHSGQTYFTLLPSGFMGLGTQNPDKPLHILTTQDNHQIKLEGANGRHTWIDFYPDGSNLIDWQIGANTNGFSIYDISAASYRLTVSNSGLVGIGTNDPQEELDVKGNIQSDYLRINAVSSNEGGEIALDGPTGYNDWRIDNYQGKFRLHHSGTNQFTVHPNGQVGIGTGNSSLGSHKLAVQGSIGAREIKVEASGWSDFVFNKDYELRTLDQVEEHINKNGHLPEIPSEAEVTENGINLGEMDAKLLQKIEELTLYMIDMNKQMAELKAKNEQLEKEISALKNE